uniref:Beta-defensin 8 n=1 Tax=Garrulax canorus TaxID=238855 RepID=A0A3G1B020_9PASS|nr:beta-defensin 8 [Garrulax canorus]
MKILSFFSAVLFLMLQGTSGFLRAPNTEVQCRQAGGVCSSHHCPPPHTRSFGRCQQGIPCCRTVVSPGGDGSHTHRRVGRDFSRSAIPPPLLWTPSTRSSCSKPCPAWP